MKRTLISLLLLTLYAGFAFTQEKVKAVIAPPPDPAMRAWMQAASPGEAHQLLARYAGEWDAEIKIQPDPSSPPVISRARAVNTLIFGGRFVETRLAGDLLGAPFEGRGYLGYDNVLKKFVNFWIDNSSTWFNLSSGTADRDGKTWRFEGEVSDFATGAMKKFLEDSVFESPDRLVYHSTELGPDGQTKISAEITYTRVK